METKIYTGETEAELKLLAELLQADELVAIPTETVYGLGGNGLSERAVKKIFAAKGRPSDNPLILHVPNKESVYPITSDVSSLAERLMDAFWPGPLTLVLPKAAHVPYVTTGGLESVAVRCPDNDKCRALLSLVDFPVGAPSANISGRPSPTTTRDVYEDMAGRIPAILDDGPCSIGLESTVVECQEDKIVILRPGRVTESMLAPFATKVEYDKGLQDVKEIPRAPGMKYKHYAPKGEMVTYVGTVSELVMAMTDYWKNLREDSDARVGFFVSEETAAPLQAQGLAACYIIFGKHGDVALQGQALYDALLTFDREGITHIVAEGTSENDFGRAVMNRLDKASNHQVILLGKV